VSIKSWEVHFDPELTLLTVCFAALDAREPPST
jgi:hypothetical protein